MRSACARARISSTAEVNALASPDTASGVTTSADVPSLDGSGGDVWPECATGSEFSRRRTRDRLAVSRCQTTSRRNTVTAGVSAPRELALLVERAHRLRATGQKRGRIVLLGVLELRAQRRGDGDQHHGGQHHGPSTPTPDGDRTDPTHQAGPGRPAGRQPGVVWNSRSIMGVHPQFVRTQLTVSGSGRCLHLMYTDTGI